MTGTARADGRSSVAALHRGAGFFRYLVRNLPSGR